MSDQHRLAGVCVLLHADHALAIVPTASLLDTLASAPDPTVPLIFVAEDRADARADRCNHMETHHATKVAEDAVFRLAWEYQAAKPHVPQVGALSEPAEDWEVKAILGVDDLARERFLIYWCLWKTAGGEYRCDVQRSPVHAALLSPDRLVACYLADGPRSVCWKAPDFMAVCDACNQKLATARTVQQAARKFFECDILANDNYELWQYERARRSTAMQLAWVQWERATRAPDWFQHALERVPASSLPVEAFMLSSL